MTAADLARQFVLDVGLRLLLLWIAAFLSIWLSWRVIGRLSLATEDNDPLTLSAREKRTRTLAGILRNVVLVGILVVASMVTLDQIGVSIGPILASAGIAGLAIGFGAQSLVKDLISGFFILLENQFDVGDTIEAAGVSGKVDSINLRVTVLRDTEGRVHFIPNGEIKVLSNLTKGYSKAVVDIAVSYESDPDLVARTLLSTAEGLRGDRLFRHRILEPPEVLGLEKLGESSAVYRIAFTTLPGSQWDVAREYRKRAKIRLAEAGIETPYPHRIVVHRSGKLPEE